MKAQPILKNILLAFALVSIGFAVGKEYTLRTVKPSTAAAISGQEDKVVVYYLHGAIRCVTCNKIERQAKETIEHEFAEDLKEGRVEWRTANFQNDDELARRFDINSSGVVLVKLSAGKETAIRKLEKVWTLVDDPVGFSAYVASEVSALWAGGRP